MIDSLCGHREQRNFFLTILDELDRDFVGLTLVKQRIRDIAAMTVMNGFRAELGLSGRIPPLHMSYTGNPGTGKTAAAERVTDTLHRLGCIRKSQFVRVRLDELAGKSSIQTTVKTKAVLNRSMGGVLFVDAASSLIGAHDEPEPAQQSLDILLHVAETRPDEIVLILAGHPAPMQALFRSIPCQACSPSDVPGLQP